MTVTENQKKSLAITSGIFALFLLILIVLKFNDTITEMADLGGGGGGGGEVAVNFGDSEFGSGTNYESKEPVKSVTKSTAPTKSSQEDVIVSENDDAPSVADIKKADKPKKEEEKKETPKPERKPDKATSNALSDLLNGNSTGDGDDNRGGNKGKSNGNTGSRNYNGGGGDGDGEGGGSGGGKGTGQGLGEGDGYGPGKGSGAGGSWNLAGRKLNGSSLVVQKCNEYGKVVVEVKVNRQGQVVGTKFTKGTQNTSQCLLDAAYATARTFRWAAKPDAPEVQTGTITINFSLGE